MKIVKRREGIKKIKTRSVTVPVKTIGRAYIVEEVNMRHRWM